MKMSYVDCVNLKTIEKDEGFVTMHINGRPIEIKVDTGAKCNVMSLDTFKGLNNGEQLEQQRKAASLVAYGGPRIETSGIATLQSCLKIYHCPQWLRTFLTGMANSIKFS